MSAVFSWVYDGRQTVRVAYRDFPANTGSIKLSCTADAPAVQTLVIAATSNGANELDGISFNPGHGPTFTCEYQDANNHTVYSLSPEFTLGVPGRSDIDDVFGAFVSGDDVERAVLAVLEYWFPVYLGELEFRLAFPPGSLPAPASYLIAEKIDREAADQLPAVIAICPGLSGSQKPIQEGTGSFIAPYSVGAGIFVSGKDRTSTQQLVRIYTAVMRSILLKNQSMNGFANGSEWLDESYDDEFGFVDDQTISAGQVIFEIKVAHVATRYKGPIGYPDASKIGQPLVEVTSATETVTLKES